MAKVKIYSTPTCTYCKQAKEIFKEEGVDFEDVDVSKDQAAAKEMVEKSGQTGVPVVEIDGEITVGFDEDKLKKLLKL